MLKKNFKYIHLLNCIALNLLIGNIAVFATKPEMSAFARILLSCIVAAALVFTFHKVSFGKKSTNWKKILTGIGCALFGQWVACIFMGFTDPIGSAFEGALKGAIPLFLLSAIFVPFWLLFAFVNSVCLYFADHN